MGWDGGRKERKLAEMSQDRKGNCLGPFAPRKGVTHPFLLLLIYYIHTAEHRPHFLAPPVVQLWDEWSPTPVHLETRHAGRHAEEPSQV